jgi:long-chain acyl-CoA synthetase
MKGYWQNPDASAKAKRGGWLHTGDVGSLDAEGFLTIKTRLCSSSKRKRAASSFI